MPIAVDLSTSATIPPISQQILMSTNNDPTFNERYSFRCAVKDSKGPRRFMEDAHSLIVPFAAVHGQGFFAIFDGHAGKHAAEWCGQNFSLYFLDALRQHHTETVPDLFNRTFHEVDNALTKISEESDGKIHSGCTVVAAFLRLEDADGRQAFLPPDFDPFAAGSELIEGSEDDSSPDSASAKSDTNTSAGAASPSKRSKLKNAFRSLGSTSHARRASQTANPPSATPAPAARPSAPAYTPPADAALRRVLYCANAGDARGVLCRAGKAVRLTYDHKGTDKQEAKRIMDAGGFVMSGRVNGVLAVTRSLGDSSMKEFVVGAPYTTETELSDEDEFIILACDGLWDVIEDQGAVDLVRGTLDPKKAADQLVDYAFNHYSTDNITVLVVRFRAPPEGVPFAPHERRASQ